MTERLDRRDFLKGATAAGLGAAFAGTGAARGGETAAQCPGGPAPGSSYLTAAGFAAPPLERVRLAFVGIGLQGGSHVRNFLAIDGVDIVALCDIDESRAREVQRWVVDAGRPAPAE